MIASQLKCHAALTHNSKMIWHSNESRLLQTHLIDIVNQIKTLDIATADFSSIELRFSKRPVTEVEPEWEGLDLSNVLVEGTPEYDEFTSQHNTDALMAASLAASLDPLYMEYMSINSAESASRFDPDSLARLRKHMETHYPDIVRRF